MGTFEKPQTCDVCFTLLKGLFYQGYRCLKCARVAHQECAPSMPSCGNQPPGKVFQIKVSIIQEWQIGTLGRTLFCLAAV